MNPTISTDNAQESIHYPWLLFRLQDNFFAINSRRVTGIMIRPDDMTQLPESPEFVRGLIMLRGNIVRLLDLRLLFSMESTESQSRVFYDLLDSGKMDHMMWVEELKNCVANNEPFELPDDPHQCRFGQWYDEYKSDIANVNHQLRKIEDPHRKLHEVAVLWAKTREQGGDGSEPTMQAAMKELCEIIVPRIGSILDETKRIFQDNVREMAIVIEEEDRRLGLIVDQVLSVEDLSLEELDDSGVNFFHDLTYIKGVCKSKNVEGNILVVNDDEILTLTAGDGNLDEIHVQSV